MTNNLKCPFCGAKLDVIRTIGRHTNYACPTCRIYGTNKIWKLAIDGKKAQDVLKEIDKYITDIVLSVAQPDGTGLLLAQRIREDALNASKKIASITKGENNE